VDTSLPTERVIQVLEMATIDRELPDLIRMNNGLESISGAVNKWAEQKEVKLVHIQPGKPAQNTCIERFNRTFREDIFNANVFRTLDEVREFGQNVDRGIPHDPPARIDTGLIAIPIRSQRMILSTFEWT
jgi:putative transposase